MMEECQREYRWVNSSVFVSTHDVSKFKESVISNLCDLNSSVENERRYFEECLKISSLVFGRKENCPIKVLRNVKVN